VTPIGEAWVVLGNGDVGLDVGGMVCSRTEVVARLGMVTWTSRCSRVQDLVHGLVPDGIEEITPLAANGASTTVLVNENVYGAAAVDGNRVGVRREQAPIVGKDLIEAVIGAGERVLARYNPTDVGREQLTQRATVPPA
jgi:hypothetical protein